MDNNIESAGSNDLVKKLEAMDPVQLQQVWDALDDYDPHSMYEGDVSMDDWAALVASEMDRRGLPKN